MRLFSFGAGRTGARSGMSDGQDDHPRSPFRLPNGNVRTGNFTDEELASVDSNPSGGFTRDVRERPPMPVLQATGDTGRGPRKVSTWADKAIYNKGMEAVRQYDAEVHAQSENRSAAMAEGDAREAEKTRRREEGESLERRNRRNNAQKKVEDKIKAGASLSASHGKEAESARKIGGRTLKEMPKRILNSMVDKEMGKY